MSKNRARAMARLLPLTLLLVAFCLHAFGGEPETERLALAGRLLLEDGTPAQGLTLHLEPVASKVFPDRGIAIQGECVAGPDGRFAFEDLPEGQYSLTFRDEPREPAVFRRALEFEKVLSEGLFVIGSDLDLGDIRVFKEGIRISGRVLREGKPVPQAKVVSLDSHREECVDVLSDEKGEYAIEIPGTRRGDRVLLAGSVTTDVQTDAGRVRHAHQLVRLDADESWQEAKLDIPVRLSDADLSGTVVDAKGEPVAGAMMYLYPKWVETTRCWTPLLKTDDQGRFLWEGVLPGLYRVSAVVPDREGASLDVEIESGKRTSITLPVPDSRTEVVFEMNFKSYYGDYRKFIEATAIARAKRGIQYGLFLATRDGALLAPRVPVGLIEIKETIPEVSVRALSPGTCFLLAAPVRYEHMNVAFMDHESLFSFHWLPSEPWIPLGGPNDVALFGPIDVLAGSQVRHAQCPEIDAETMRRLSKDLNHEFREIPTVMIERVKRLLANEVNKK